MNMGQHQSKSYKKQDILSIGFEQKLKHEERGAAAGATVRCGTWGNPQDPLKRRAPGHFQYSSHLLRIGIFSIQSSY